LGNDLPVHQVPHLGVRADLPVAARVLRIINATYAHLAYTPFSRDWSPSAASEGAVNWAKLISAKFHRFLQIEIVESIEEWRFAVRLTSTAAHVRCATRPLQFVGTANQPVRARDFWAGLNNGWPLK
jgi:hypothetical protein